MTPKNNYQTLLMLCRYEKTLKPKDVLGRATFNIAKKKLQRKIAEKYDFISVEIDTEKYDENLIILYIEDRWECGKCGYDKILKGSVNIKTIDNEKYDCNSTFHWYLIPISNFLKGRDAFRVAMNIYQELRHKKKE